jgi:hypothetical protein
MRRGCSGGEIFCLDIRGRLGLVWSGGGGGKEGVEELLKSREVNVEGRIGLLGSEKYEDLRRNKLSYCL